MNISADDLRTCPGTRQPPVEVIYESTGIGVCPDPDCQRVVSFDAWGMRPHLPPWNLNPASLYQTALSNAARVVSGEETP